MMKDDDNQHIHENSFRVTSDKGNKQNGIEPIETNQPILFVIDFKIVPTFGVSQCGKRNILHDGFEYVSYRVNKFTTAWRCLRSDDCKAEVITKSINGTVLMKRTKVEHNHNASQN